MKYEIFPNQLKFALVKPIFKKGDSSETDSYRLNKPGYLSLKNFRVNDKFTIAWIY